MSVDPRRRRSDGRTGRPNGTPEVTARFDHGDTARGAVEALQEKGIEAGAIEMMGSAIDRAAERGTPACAIICRCSA